MRRSARAVCHEMISVLVDVAGQACDAGGRPDLASQLRALPPVSNATAEAFRTRGAALRREVLAGRSSGPERRHEEAAAESVWSCIDAVANVAAPWTSWSTPPRLVRILELELGDVARRAVDVGVLDVRAVLLAEGAGYATATSLGALLDPVEQEAER